nr:S1 family peptidase [Streptomyces sp. MST-110588]
MAAAGTGALAFVTAATFTLAGTDANAAPAPTSAVRTLTPAAASALATRLPDGTAGSYYDAKARTLVVDVVDEASAAAVRAKGARPRTVSHSRAELDAARRTLEFRAAIPGTSWSVDPRINKVLVTADRTVKGAALKRLAAVVRGLGDRARIQYTKGEFKPLIAGGDAIWGSDSRCSLGFNVTRGGRPYFLTAGHCGSQVPSWSDTQGGARIAATVDARFPGDDFALVRYTANTEHPSEVNLYDGGTQPITRAGEAVVGQSVQRSGSTSQVHQGVVTGLDETVNYQQGPVHGLIRTTVCAEPGDSGGPLFDGATALGLTSGGSGDCTEGGQTFFQPVTEPLAVYGARLG